MATARQVRSVVRGGMGPVAVLRTVGIERGIAALGLSRFAGHLSATEWRRPGAVARRRAEARADELRRWAAGRAARHPAGGDTDDEADDLIVVLVHDHDVLAARLAGLLDGGRSPDGGGTGQLVSHAAASQTLIEALSSHEAAEEQVLWPAVRDTLAQGESIARTALRQEREGRRLLRKLSRLDPDEPGFDAAAVAVADAVRRHVSYEEAVFVRLATELAAGPRHSLAEAARRAMRISPTRPHRFMPAEPGLLRLGAPLAAAVDRLRDRPGRHATPVSPPGRRGGG